MKVRLMIAFGLLVSLTAYAQDQTTVIEASSGAGDGLDLQAVGELFKDAENLEDFERALNDPDTGVNNLDLNEDGDVDYIRVIEEASDETRLIILQVALGEDEFQDVASIAVEKEDDGYQMQVHGHTDIYGPDVYYAPTAVYVQTWPIVGWLYRPAWRPYRSAYYWGYYPHWWKPYRPVHVNVYRPRIASYTTRRTFVVRTTPRVHTVHRVKYTPHNSVLVKKKTVHQPASKPVVAKKTKVSTPRGTVKQTTVKKSNTTVKKTTVKKGNTRKTTVKKKN